VGEHDPLVLERHGEHGVRREGARDPPQDLLWCRMLEKLALTLDFGFV
jgi:hypothetical protein